MGICTWVKEVFYGKDDVAAPPVEKPKIVESFCRSDRMNEFAERLRKDMAKIEADFFRIVAIDDPTEYRGEISDGKIVIYNCDTLELVEDPRTLYVNGVKSGSYHSYTAVMDTRSRYSTSDRPRKQDWEVMPRFKNDIEYYDCNLSYQLYRSASSARPKEIPINVREYLDLVKRYNKDMRFRVLVHGGKNWVVKYDDLVKWVDNPKSSQTLYNEVDSKETLYLPGYVSMYIERKDYIAIDSKGQVITLLDPIRVIELGNDEDTGVEGYVALRKEEYDGTFTRLRFRVEVDTEELFQGKIVNLQNLFEDIAKRVKWMNIPDDGRFYLDNVVCKLKDGTTHTLDNSGFRSIGAEVYWAARSRLGAKFLSGGEFHEYGFWMITQNEFPKEPTY